MKADRIALAVFSGTGNTLVAANALADALRRAGKTVIVLPMHRAGAAEALATAGFNASDGDWALGIAVTVAAFSTYPAAWRFIESLPEGKGREAFFLATMGGAGFGMQGPIARVLRRKGYAPVGAALIRMCGNYGNDIPAPEAFAAVRARAVEKADDFCRRLLTGQARWGCGWLNIFSSLLAWTAKTGRSFKTFRRFVPLAADAGKCTGCGLCARQCSAQAIAMIDSGGKAVASIDACQRCAAYCPAAAIGVPGKETRQHRPVPPEAMAAFLDTNTLTR